MSVRRSRKFAESSTLKKKKKKMSLGLCFKTMKISLGFNSQFVIFIYSR